MKYNDNNISRLRTSTTTIICYQRIEGRLVARLAIDSLRQRNREKRQQLVKNVNNNDDNNTLPAEVTVSNEYLTEELHNVDAPGAQTSCCLTLGPNEFWVELFVRQVYG